MIGSPPSEERGIRGPQSRVPGSTPIPGQMGGPLAPGGVERRFGGPHLCGRDPEGLGDLGVELADVGEALNLARGAAVRQLRAEDQARTGAGRGWGLRGRGRGRGRARGLGTPGLLGRGALHGRRSWATPATATAVAAGSAASCSLPSPGPGRDSRAAGVRGSRNPSRPGRRHRGLRRGVWPQVSGPCQGQLRAPGGRRAVLQGPELQTGEKQGSPMRT